MDMMLIKDNKIAVETGREPLIMKLAVLVPT